MSHRSKVRSRRTLTLALLVVVLVVAALAVALPALADQQPTVSVDAVSVVEPDTGTTSAVFSVRLTQASPNVTTVAYATADESATAPADYTEATGQLVFAPGTTSKTVTVSVVGDTRHEDDETFQLVVSSPSGAVVRDVGHATIVDSDPQPYVSVGGTTVVEGDAGTVAALFPVTLTRPTSENVRVRYETSDGTAGAGEYRYTRGTLTIPAGQTSASVAVPVLGDTIDEDDSERFSLELSAPSGAALLGDTATGTIVDDDRRPSLWITEAAVTEGDSGTSPLVFTVQLSGPSTVPVVARYTTDDGSATAGADYTATRGTLTIDPGQTSKTVTVPVKGDTVNEGDSEYLFLFLSSVTGADPLETGALGEIVDDDPRPSTVSFVTVDPTTVKEGTTGTTNARFTIRVTPAAASAVVVRYETSDGTATSGADYRTTRGQVTIPAGSTTATVDVPVLGDSLIEGDEQFGLGLTDATHATIDESTASATILDDDLAPIAAVVDTAVPEGSTGTTDATFQIVLSGPSAVTASVRYQTSDNTASAPSDYTSVSGTATFQPGQISKTVHVPIAADRKPEPDERFGVELSSPTGATIATETGRVVIVDDDHLPTLTVDDPSVYEGTGGTATATFTVTLSAASAVPVSAHYATGDGSAVAPADYTATSGTVTFAVGQTTRTVDVPIVTDSLDEDAEYLFLDLTAPVNATALDPDGTLTVLDDDTRPGLSVDDVSAAEPDSGSVRVAFHVTLSAPAVNPVTVAYRTASGLAVSPDDFTAATGSLTFTPGQTSKTVSVTLKGDTVHEADEDFSLLLQNPAGASLVDPSGSGTIIDQDPLPDLVADRVGVVEGNNGTTSASFTVRLQPASPNQVTVAYATADGTAQAGSDYVATNGTLTFAAGQTSKQVTVAVRGDTSRESSETFALKLSKPKNAVILDGNGVGTIFDDDPSGSGSLLSVGSVTVAEPDSGSTDALFTVTLTPPAAAPVTVDYATTDGSAVHGADYGSRSGTLTFAAGQMSATVSVPVSGDTLDERDEVFSFDLSAISGKAVFGADRADGVILDNDTAPLVSIGDVTVAEGNTGTVDAAFSVRLLQPSSQPVWVDWGTRDGTAGAPRDYLDDGGTLFFAPGEISTLVHVAVVGDTLVEGDEDFAVELSNPSGATFATSQRTGTGSIVDFDAFPVLGGVELRNGSAAPGVTVTLRGNDGTVRTRTVGSDGGFAFDDVTDGQYTLTPSAPGRTFAPASSAVTVRGAALTGITFIAMTTPGAGAAGAVATANRTGS